MATTIQKQAIEYPVYSFTKVVGQLSEWFWFLLSFSLFLVLGPFAAPVVLIVLVKLGLEHADGSEPESIQDY